MENAAAGGFVTDEDIDGREDDLGNASAACSAILQVTVNCLRQHSGSMTHRATVHLAISSLILQKPTQSLFAALVAQ
jgi:hypothetical protein